MRVKAGHRSVIESCYFRGVDPEAARSRGNQHRAVGRTKTLQIATRTAVIPTAAIQAAYNDAVMSERLSLAREIAQLWLGVLVEQRVERIQIPSARDAPKRKARAW